MNQEREENDTGCVMKQVSPVGTWSSLPLGTLGINLEPTSQSCPICGSEELGYLYNDPVGHWWRTASELLHKGVSVVGESSWAKNCRCWSRKSGLEHQHGKDKGMGWAMAVSAIPSRTPCSFSFFFFFVCIASLLLCAGFL